jgi:hypothetical protein
MSGQVGERGRPPEPFTRPTHHEFARPDDGEVEWFTIAETARVCRRAPATIRNIVSRYQLRRRTAWTVRNRRRERRILLAPKVVMWIQGVTLFRKPPEFPPT